MAAVLFRLIAPVKSMLAPVLLVRLIAELALLPVRFPLNVTVPLERLATLTMVPVLPLIVAATVMLPPAAPVSETPLVLPWTSRLGPIVAVVIASPEMPAVVLAVPVTPALTSLDVDAVGQGDTDATDGAVEHVRVGRPRGCDEGGGR